MNHLKDDFEFHIRWKPFLLNPFIPDGESIPMMDYLRLKFGDEAAQRFVSGNSPVSKRGKELVSTCMGYNREVLNNSPSLIGCDLLAKTWSSEIVLRVEGTVDGVVRVGLVKVYGGYSTHKQIDLLIGTNSKKAGT